jgi:hypothetical protein
LEGERAEKIKNPTLRGAVEYTATRFTVLTKKLERTRKKRLQETPPEGSALAMMVRTRALTEKGDFQSFSGVRATTMQPFTIEEGEIKGAGERGGWVSPHIDPSSWSSYDGAARRRLRRTANAPRR